MNVNTDESKYGLAASGTSRCWDVSIDESLTQNNEWIGEIEGPNFYITFQLNDIRIVSQVKSFLTQQPTNRLNQRIQFAQASLVLGKFGQTSVSLVRDDESLDRCFLIVGGKSRSCIRISLFKEDMRMLEDAFCQASMDLE